MRNILFTLRYDGRAFHGWQIQRNALTVQEAFQEALFATFGARCDIKACSRTDAGVHARMFCVSARTESRIPCEKLVAALNARLPRTIAVTGCREVPEDFHARYSALGKRYSYEIWNAPVRDPFREGLATHWPHPIDEKTMLADGLPLMGTHDFASFQAAGSEVEDTIRTVSGFDVLREGDLVRIVISADGFLYNMVRIIAGTLLDMQRGRLPHGGMTEIIEARGRSAAGFTAPPDGLFLDRVYYPAGIGGDTM